MVRTAQDFGWLLLTGWQNTPLAVIVATPTLWPVRRSPLTRTMAGGVVARRSRVDDGADGHDLTRPNGDVGWWSRPDETGTRERHGSLADGRGK